MRFGIHIGHMGGLLDPEQQRANLQGKHFRLSNTPNNPKPLQPRIPIWIGGRGEKRTLRAAAMYADGWNGAYIGPEDWKHKSQVLARSAKARTTGTRRRPSRPTSCARGDRVA